jgi:hypothetical protein
MTVSWSKLRGTSEESFNEITTLSNNNIPRLFVDIFGLQFKSPINRIIVTTDVEYNKKEIETPAEEKEETPSTLQKKQISLNLSDIPFLGIEKIPRQREKSDALGKIYFNTIEPEIDKQFKNVVEKINKGWVYAYIKQLRSALQNKILTGAPENYNYLASLIGVDSEVNVVNLDKNIVTSLNEVEAFLKYFVDIMVRRVTKTGSRKDLFDVSDDLGKDVVRKKIKSLLGVEEKDESSQKTSQATPEQELKQIKISEPTEARIVIRNILLEKMKHF